MAAMSTFRVDAAALPPSMLKEIPIAQAAGHRPPHQQRGAFDCVGWEMCLGEVSETFSTLRTGTSALAHPSMTHTQGTGHGFKLPGRGQIETECRA